MDFKDKISTKWNDELEAYQSVNMDKFSSIGVQWKVRVGLLDNLELTLNGYAADPKEETSGVEAQAGARVQLSPGLFYDDGKISAGVYAEFVLERERGLPDYTNSHFQAGYMVTKWMKLKLQIDNLLDDDEQVLYGNMTPGNRVTYVTYDPGFWIMGGVEIYYDLL